jgi:hypothetical protein
MCLLVLQGHSLHPHRCIVGDQALLDGPVIDRIWLLVFGGHLLAVGHTLVELDALFHPHNAALAATVDSADEGEDDCAEDSWDYKSNHLLLSLPNS